jgi:hypothetical protein
MASTLAQILFSSQAQMASSATIAPLNNHHTSPSMFGGMAHPFLTGFFIGFFGGRGPITCSLKS